MRYVIDLLTGLLFRRILVRSARRLTSLSSKQRPADIFSAYFRSDAFLFKLAVKSQIIRMDPLVANINEGENVNVSCFATGIPTPTYSWTFRGNSPRKSTTTQIP